MNSAVAPTFCMKLDVIPTVAESIDRIRDSEGPPILTMNDETTFITPVRSSPAPRIITAMMAITALEAKPEKS